MYAYCNNNPVCYSDYAGTIKTLADDKFVHDQVLKEICRRNTDLRWRQTCIRFSNSGGKGIPTNRSTIGFCDLYNIETGEVWELKKYSDSWSCSTAYATAQLDRYVSGTLLWYPQLELTKPQGTIIGRGYFRVYRDIWIYDIEYWYAGSGIIRYSYEKTLNRELLEAEIAAITASLTIAGIIKLIGKVVIAFA